MGKVRKHRRVGFFDMIGSRAKTPRVMAVSLLCLTVAISVCDNVTAQTPVVERNKLPADNSGDNLTEIVVIGKDLKNREQVRRLAARITRDAGTQVPLARFYMPVCFTTFGLPMALAETFSKRLVKNASEAGVTVAGAGCKPNSVIIFADDGHRELQLIRKKQSWLFGSLTPFEIDRSINEPGPVHAWSSIEIRPSGSGGSIVVSAIRRDISSAFIVIDRQAAIGKTVRQLADYATMRALAVIRASGVDRGQDTILTLFRSDQTAPPRELTPFDRGYLRESYFGEANLKSSTKISQIARRISKDASAIDLPVAN